MAVNDRNLISNRTLSGRECLLRPQAVLDGDSEVRLRTQWTGSVLLPVFAAAVGVLLLALANVDLVHEVVATAALIVAAVVAVISAIRVEYVLEKATLKLVMHRGLFGMGWGALLSENVSRSALRIDAATIADANTIGGWKAEALVLQANRGESNSERVLLTAADERESAWLRTAKTAIDSCCRNAGNPGT